MKIELGIFKDTIKGYLEDNKSLQDQVDSMKDYVNTVTDQNINIAGDLDSMADENHHLKASLDKRVRGI